MYFILDIHKLSQFFHQHLEIIYTYLNSVMEQLKRLIKDASNQFECHNFQTSLSLYVRCIQKCEEQKMPNYILHNLKSSEAALRAILGEQQAGLSILNSILNENKQHWLALLRRSQIYKRQNNLKKAKKDLQVLSMYAPDNMQIAALKMEINNLMSKNHSLSESQSSDSQEEERIDEQQVLQFSNLKRIDRTSVSIMVPTRGRQSRVTISGDSSFCYQAQNQKPERSPRQSTKLTPHFIRQKFIDIEAELEETGESDKNQESNVPIVIKSTPQRTKSILRNRNSKIYVQNSQTDLTKSEQGKKLIQKIQNIEGHVIGSEHGSAHDCGQRQVEFKKSFMTLEEQPQEFQTGKIKKKASGRKSCLKRSSFSINTEQIQKAGRRNSKFDGMSRSSIDGKMIKSDIKLKQEEKNVDKQNIGKNNNEDSGNQSEEGSQFNIFGSAKLDVNKQLRQNLGIISSQVETTTTEPAKKSMQKKRTQSILKKTSLTVQKQGKSKKMSVFFKQPQDVGKNEKKSKKSVMFRTC